MVVNLFKIYFSDQDNHILNLTISDVKTGKSASFRLHKVRETQQMNEN